MRRGFRWSLGIRFTLALFLASLISPLSGCGKDDQMVKAGDGQAVIPATLKQSNDNMENFMKSKSGGKRQTGKSKKR